MISRYKLVHLWAKAWFCQISLTR